ncbi:hypothetical protein LSM04_001169 [Trypanosoma melophagium]|uniref:uncharacterized protein n=1 Tax=Trypanosoma melophagium TaxID=715481 RepID=UPI00351A9E48|nr:hypothetical protein LSM04_001169 [Trypanosoma melophagium]
MFVQLRRLVCLLLLLQCCLGVRPVKAEEYPTKKDVEVAEKKLNEWIVLADKLLAEGEGCYSEWLDAVYKCGNSSERVKEAAETAKEVGVGECRTSCGQQQSEVEAKITKIQDAINESKTSLNNRAFITLACFNILGNMKHEAEGVKEEGLSCRKCKKGRKSDRTAQKHKQERMSGELRGSGSTNSEGGEGNRKGRKQHCRNGEIECFVEEGCPTNSNGK